MPDLPEISDEMVDAAVPVLRSSVKRHGAFIGTETAERWVRDILAAAMVASGWRPEADVRKEIAHALSLPALHALRCIPDGEIRNGCVIHDGAQVRERLRRAYLDIQTPPTEKPMTNEGTKRDA